MSELAPFQAKGKISLRKAIETAFSEMSEQRSSLPYHELSARLTELTGVPWDDRDRDQLMQIQGTATLVLNARERAGEHVIDLEPSFGYVWADDSRAFSRLDRRRRKAVKQATLTGNLAAKVTTLEGLTPSQRQRAEQLALIGHRVRQIAGRKRLRPE